MEGKFSEPVYILGSGCTRFGNLLETPEIKNLTLQELAAQAVKEALADAKTSPDEIDAFIIGNVTMQTSNLPATYSQLSKWIGMEMKAGVHIDAGCSTTNAGAAIAATSIASGVYKKVLVVGIESTLSRPYKLSPYERETIPTEEMWLWTDYCINQAYSVPQGYDIFPVYNGIVALGYCRKYGYSIEEFDRCMFELCKTRRMHASMNKKAINQERLEDEAKRMGFNDPYEFWKSPYNPYLAWPSRLRSAVVPADGASAMILSCKEGADEYDGMPIELKGFGISVGDLPWYAGDSTVQTYDVHSFKKAYDMAGIKPEDIDYLHVHDCSHITSVCVAELSGYLPEGKGIEYAKEGRLRFDGDRPMSTHGGRHAFGHAWAASAGSDTYEAMKQMRGIAGQRQIKSAPEICVLHTHGYGMISTVLVLKGGK
jgi:acetyl-CoA C-acetyltransferase